MPRHGENTSCCGSTCGDFFPDSFWKIRDARLEEAAGTGAELLLDVCHYCHEVFAPHEKRTGNTLINYIDLVARALGLEARDTFKLLRQLGSVDRIMEELREGTKASPFSEDQIRQALKKRIATSGP